MISQLALDWHSWEVGRNRFLPGFSGRFAAFSYHFAAVCAFCCMAPAEYNLLTFKALKDPLAAWTLKELAGHGVNYRKFVSPDLDHLLPEDQFRLLAASMHFPRQLASRVTLQPRGPGAYDVMWGTDPIRILVLREMPEAEQNLVWN